MKKAPFYKIFFSSVYDLILLLAVLFLFVFLFVVILGESISGIKKVGFQIYLASIIVIYYAYFWVSYGQTLAMQTWKIKLISKNNKIITFRLALKRLILCIFFSITFINFFWFLFSKKREFLHDKLCNTAVICTK